MLSSDPHQRKHGTVESIHRIRGRQTEQKFLVISEDILQIEQFGSNFRFQLRAISDFNCEQIEAATPNAWGKAMVVVAVVVVVVVAVVVVVVCCRRRRNWFYLSLNASTRSRALSRY